MFFTASWCPPCKRFKSSEIPKLKKSGWSVSESSNSNIRIIDIDKYPSLYREWSLKTGKSSIPMFVKLVDGKIISVKVGFYTATNISRWYNE